jgi:hypothetical protein
MDKTNRTALFGERPEGPQEIAQPVRAGNDRKNRMTKP